MLAVLVQFLTRRIASIAIMPTLDSGNLGNIYINIPEGLAISLVLVPRGVGWFRAALWSIFSSLPQPLMAVPAFLFVDAFRSLLPYGLGFAAGTMIWMVFSELMPDALEETSSNLIAVVVTLSVVAMTAFQVLIR